MSKTSTKPTKVVFLLDRSGSMSSVKEETISGFNSYLDGLEEKDRIRVTAVQFDSEGIDKICDGQKPKNATRLTDKTYEPRSWTPLYDAIGKTIRETKAKQGEEKVLFVILTDGQENASTEFNQQSVKKLMKEREDDDKWTFAFIGMGPDGWTAAQTISAGLRSSSNVMKTAQTGAATRQAYRAMGQATTCYASSIGSDKQVMTGFWDKKDDKK